MRFAAIGLDHRHIYDLVEGLIAAGQACVGYDPDSTDPRVIAGFRKRFAHVPSAERGGLLEDPAIDFIVTAAVPCDRAAVAIAAMRNGKDVIVDKPAVTTREQLATVQRTVADTGRIWSVCFSERFLTPST
ncbi:MAG TPA: Gfo/Idh/MocA family oxidoreductase, partial [Acetobacteraceae bacterium]